MRVSERSSVTTPIIKWIGGKTKLLPELVKRMPRTYNRYFEPFAGGAALFFHLEPSCPAFISDVNADLIAMYSAVRDDVEMVIHWLKMRASVHMASQDGGMADAFYAGVRSRWNAREGDDIERAANFIYLNKTCFNGLWRVNSKGEFNAAMGRYVKPAICEPDKLRYASKVLNRFDSRSGGVELMTCSYATGCTEAKRGDFVYMDPPYHPASETANFTSYTAGSFGADQQHELADTARKLVARGVQVMLSNSDTPFIRELYSWARIDTVQRSGSVNCDPTKRGKVNEVIITGGYEHE